MTFPRMIFSLLGLFPFLTVGQVEARAAEPFQPGSTSVLLTQVLPSAPLQFVPPAAPERGRPPGRHQGGASRGGCDLAGQPPLTALIPFSKLEKSPDVNAAEEKATDIESTKLKQQSSNSQSSEVFSLTMQARPSFWFYVPYSLEATPLEFVLQDEDNNTLYQSNLSVNAVDSSDRGIIQIILPDAAPALQPGMTYHWYFMAYCDQSDPSFVDGWIARSPLPPVDFLDTATPREQARFYAQHGIWQETLTLLGERYRESMTDADAARDWESLLESANLTQVMEQPLVDCCSLE